MALDIRIAQFFKLTAANGQQHYYQNYFANETRNYGNKNIVLRHSKRKAQQQP